MSNIPSLSAQQFLSVSQRDVAGLFAYIRDPLTQILNNAVILVPCGCSFSPSTAFEICGRHPSRCLNTLCSSPVLGYLPNYSLRHMERLICQIQSHVATIWPVITPVIAQQIAQEAPEGALDPFSFPAGKGGRFECSEPWHAVKDIMGVTCRKMTLKSVSMDSLLTEIDIIGLKNGRTHISLRCRMSQEQVFENYLARLEILDDDHCPGFFVARQPRELEWVLRILANHHSLPESQFAFLRCLVESEGFWPRIEEIMRDGPQDLPPLAVEHVADAPLLSQQEVESALDGMQDPITMQNVKDGVALVPCGHSVSQSTALTLFGAATQDWHTARGRCSICRSIVVNYIPNHSLRHLERCIQRMQISATVITQQILEDVLPPLPFPGLGAHFECSKSWSVTSDLFSKFCREMTFKSMTPGSLLQSVSVFGKSDGRIEIAFTWDQSHQQVVRDYLSSLGFESSVHLGVIFIAELPHELDWTLRFLVNNNVLPEREREFLTRLVESREWPSVESVE